MRQIKFRYRFKNNKTGNIVTATINLNNLEYPNFYPNVFDFLTYEILSRDQFTGLDQHGKETYEGDKVRYATGNDERPFMEEVVEFRGGAFYPICTMPKNEFEIIGNIYETPEVIKNGK